MRNNLNYVEKNSDVLLEGIGESLRRFGDSKELLQKVLDTIPQTVFWKDVNLNYLGCNQLFANNAGKSSPADLIGLSDFDLPRTNEEAIFYRSCDRRVMDTGVAEMGIIESQINADGQLTWLETNKAPLHNDNGEVIGVLGTYNDITRLKRAEEGLQRDNEELERRVEERTRELRFVAHHDGLTGLANRMYFVQQLNEVLESNEDEHFALMFIDLDDFKPVNDTEGHEAGDKLLVAVAKTLKSVLGPFDFAGRFGGDEFLILLRGMEGKQEVVHACDYIRERLNCDIKINGRCTMITASIGIVFSDSTQYQSSDTLINDADIAMYAAKAQGKNHHQFFSEELRDSVSAVPRMKEQIVSGIKNDQFVLHFQPIVNLSQRTLAGFESLVRWQHPTKGLLSPENFIPEAESTGMIVQLGRHIIECGCRQLAQWQNDIPNLPEDFKLNINVSPRQLLDPGFTDSLLESVDRYELQTHTVCLEITESLLFEDSDQAIKLLRQLRAYGFHLSLDDFGTGYSSLSYLDNLPVDALKIDRSFVNKLEDQFGDHAIIRMIIALAETLKIGVVAEGVETQQQLQLLESMNCKSVQGYFFSKPMPAENATAYLTQHQSSPCQPAENHQPAL